jgi:hypothetical protein
LFSITSILGPSEGVVGGKGCSLRSTTQAQIFKYVSAASQNAAAL